MGERETSAAPVLQGESSPFPTVDTTRPELIVDGNLALKAYPDPTQSPDLPEPISITPHLPEAQQRVLRFMNASAYDYHNVMTDPSEREEGEILMIQTGNVDKVTEWRGYDYGNMRVPVRPELAQQALDIEYLTRPGVKRDSEKWIETHAREADAVKYTPDRQTLDAKLDKIAQRRMEELQARNRAGVPARNMRYAVHHEQIGNLQPGIGSRVLSERAAGKKVGMSKWGLEEAARIRKMNARPIEVFNASGTYDN